jgi:hypothetical protein
LSIAFPARLDDKVKAFAQRLRSDCEGLSQHAKHALVDSRPPQTAAVGKNPLSAVAAKDRH